MRKEVKAPSPLTLCRRSPNWSWACASRGRFGVRRESADAGATPLWLGVLSPGAEVFDERGGAVAEPAIELGLVLELLTAHSGDGDELAVDVRKGGEVAPEFFELGDGEDVFLGVAPAFFDVFEGDVSGHPGGEVADGGVDPVGGRGWGGGGVGGIDGCRGEEIGAGQLEDFEQLVEVDPGGHRVVVGEFEFLLFAGHGEAFDESWAAIDAGEAAAAIVEAARNDLEGEAGVLLDMEAEQGRVEIGAEGVDVMEEEIAELGPLLEELGERAVAEEIGDFEPMTDGMEALEREVIGVIGGLAGGMGPVDESGAEAIADFLLLFVE